MVVSITTLMIVDMSMRLVSVRIKLVLLRIAKLCWMVTLSLKSRMDKLFCLVGPLSGSEVGSSLL